ncbi:MAG: alpha/beta hydrolase [Parvularcula sp.]
MRKFLILLVLPLLAACTGPQLLNSIARNPDRNTERIRDIAYGPLERQRLDLYVPDAAGPHPVLIFFHGGGWERGNKDEYAFAGKRFAAMGYLTAVVNYRLTPEGKYPVFMEDAAAATAKVARIASSYGGDPDYLFLTGHSAGGYIVVQLAVAEEFLAAEGLSIRDIDGVVGNAGPYDFLPSDLEVVHKAFGRDDDGAVSMPVNRVTADAPPMLLLAGGKDTDVLSHNAPNMAKALKAKGVPVTVKVYPDASHEDMIIAVALGGRRFSVAQDTDEFFRSLPKDRPGLPGEQ